MHRLTHQQRALHDCPHAFHLHTTAVLLRKIQTPHRAPLHKIIPCRRHHVHVLFDPPQAADTEHTSAAITSSSPEDVVRAFYTAVNAKNIDNALQYIADDILYEDFTYPDPKVGKGAVQAFLQDVCALVPDGLDYIVDDITSGDDSKVGVVWHVELDGKPFPNARGCSFYKINSQGKICYARDIVESPIKAGDVALQAIGTLAPLVKQFGSNPTIPWASVGLWGFYAAYVSLVMFSTIPPGLPATQTPPSVFQELFNMSLNFFYVNIAANAVGLTFIPSPVEHPVYEAFFNTVNAWSLMFLPVILHDRRTQSLGERTQVAWWLGIFFVTNVFFVPYLAIRAAQPEPPHTHVELDGYPQELPATTSGSSTSTSASTAGETIPPPTPPPTWAPAVGITGFLILSISAAWLVTGRPEFGGWDARWEYVVEKFNTDRVFWAFVLDCGLYSVWQAMLVGPRAAPAYRFVPFVGLAAWLCAGMPEQESKA